MDVVMHALPRIHQDVVEDQPVEKEGKEETLSHGGPDPFFDPAPSSSLSVVDAQGEGGGEEAEEEGRRHALLQESTTAQQKSQPPSSFASSRDPWRRKAREWKAAEEALPVDPPSPRDSFLGLPLSSSSPTVRTREEKQRIEKRGARRRRSPVLFPLSGDDEESSAVAGSGGSARSHRSLPPGGDGERGGGGEGERAVDRCGGSGGLCLSE